ncbi:hypothetical protein WBK50_13115 [Pseudonocardia sp. T1-2H]|uniref:hypothetical protein n=1 Tax=Pseudonocardia sp. T1-2H TaxID=3128899 RepID=UPI003100ED71
MRPRVFGDDPQLVQALPQSPVGALDQAVGVEQHQVAGIQPCRLHRGRRGGDDTEWPTGADGQVADPSARGQHQRGRMPGAGVVQPAVGRVQDRQAHRAGHRPRHPGDEAVQPGQHLGQLGTVEEQLHQHGPQLAHDRRGPRAGAHDVADGQSDPAVAERHGVEPVTAGALFAVGDQVAGRHPHPGQHRQPLRQQAALQGHGPVHRRLVALFERGGPGLGRTPGRDHVGHIHRMDDHPAHRTVAGAGGHHGEVEVELPEPSIAVGVRQDAPLAPGDRAPTGVSRVELLRQPPAGHLGKRFPVGETDDRAAGIQQGPCRSVDRDEDVVRSLEDEHAGR